MDNCIAVTGTHAIAYWLSDRSRALDDVFNDSQGEGHGKRANFMAYRDGVAERPELFPVPECTPHLERAEATALAGYFGQPLPIQVAILDASLRRESATLQCHPFQKSIPCKQFIKCSDRVYIATPEYALLQIARTMPLVELVVLISMLCGMATFDRSGGGRLIPRRPVCSLEGIKRFLEQCQSSAKRMPHGSKRLASALVYAIEGSASPPEISCGLRISLPRRLGGYGFGQVSCNCQIAVEGKSRYADLCIPDKCVCIEYQSDSEHSDKAARKRDDARRNEIVAAGYKLFVLNSTHYSSATEMDCVANQVGSTLRKRFDKGTKAIELRENLRQEIEAAMNTFRKWAMMGAPENHH